MDLNGFMKHWSVIGVTWGHFGVTLGVLAAHGGDFEATFGSL